MDNPKRGRGWNKGAEEKLNQKGKKREVFGMRKSGRLKNGRRSKRSTRCGLGSWLLGSRVGERGNERKWCSGGGGGEST